MRFGSWLGLLPCFVLALLACSCSTQSKVEQKRDPFFGEVARLGDRWRQCYVENQTIQMAQVEEELCDKVRSNFRKFSEGMSSSDNLTRIWCARSLGFAKTPEALPFLLSALNDPLEEVRVNALFSIAFLRDPNTPVERITVMMSDQSDHVRHNAMHAIQNLVDVGNDKGAMPTILRGLEDRFPPVRNEAVIALKTIRDKSTAKAIIEKSLKDDYHHARINAALALGAINSREAIEPLIGMLADSNGHVREAAGTSLRMITGADMGDELKTWREWWESNKGSYEKPDEHGED
jgi:vesicle coat complex subunit